MTDTPRYVLTRTGWQSRPMSRQMAELLRDRFNENPEMTGEYTVEEVKP